MSRDQLLAQGQCCGNCCLNCPYNPKHTKGSIEINKASNSQ